MTNDEFQMAVLRELNGINDRVNGINDRVSGINDRVNGINDKVNGINDKVNCINDRVNGINDKINHIEISIGELKEGQKQVEIRQDEIYQLVRAIEHSNQVGKSELDSQNIRLAKVEGKLKKVAKAYNDETNIDKASNL